MIKRDGDDALQKSLLERKYEDGDEHVSVVLRAKGGEIGEEEGGDTKGTTVFQTGVNMLNELEGSGLLGLPYAAKLCGWASIGCMVLVGIMAGITGFVLAAAMYDGVGRREKKRVCSSYAEVGRRAFGQRGERAVLIVQMLNLIFVGVVYLVLVGNAMHSVYSIASDSTQDKRLWTSIAFLCAFPTVHFGGYRKVSLMSLLGIVCLTGIIVCGVGFSSKHIYEHGTSTMPKFDASHIFATASMFLFAYSAHGIFPDLEDSMARKEKFGQVVAVVFSTNIILKAAVTMTGVLAYGEATEQVRAKCFVRARICVVVLPVFQAQTPRSHFFEHPSLLPLTISGSHGQSSSRSCRRCRHTRFDEHSFELSSSSYSSISHHGRVSKTSLEI